MEALIIAVVAVGGYVIYRSFQKGREHEDSAMEAATRRAKEAEAPYKVEPPSLNPASWPFPTAVGVKQETAEPVAKKAPAKKTAAAKKATPAKKAAPAKKTAAKKTAAKKTPAKKTTGTKKSK